VVHIDWPDLDAMIAGIEPIFPNEMPRVRRSLLEPIGTADAFARVIGDLAGDLAGELTRIGHGARRLDLYFHRVDGQVEARRVGTARPTRDAAHIAKLLVPKIETIDPGFGVEAMMLVASLTDRLGPSQRDLASDGRRDPDLGAVVDALANRFGHRSLYRLAPKAAAMPERTIELVPALAAHQGRRWADDLPRPGRLIEPPEPIDVIAMLPDHPPRMFVWRRRRHAVVLGEGPERLHGEWWLDSGVEARLPYSTRDYFQVEVEGGGRYWIFRLGDGERAASGPMRWFIHGAFA
jgi:protein ImuB